MTDWKLHNTFNFHVCESKKINYLHIVFEMLISNNVCQLSQFPVPLFAYLRIHSFKEGVIIHIVGAATRRVVAEMVSVNQKLPTPHPVWESPQPNLNHITGIVVQSNPPLGSNPLR